MGNDQVLELLIAGQNRIEAGLTVLNSKIDETNKEVSEIKLGIASIGIQPRLTGLEEFKKTWEPKLTIGLAAVAIIGTGLGFLFKSILK